MLYPIDSDMKDKRDPQNLKDASYRLPSPEHRVEMCYGHPTDEESNLVTL
jgi:hypothetical protein